MGILNVTPDSFYDGGKYSRVDKAVIQAKKMVSEGADIIDIGGMSSRPGAELISSADECKRVLPVIQGILKQLPDTILSIDTVYAATATAAYEAGISIVNDISAGSIDKQMHKVIAQLKVPYIAMHMQGEPSTMQDEPAYDEVVLEVAIYLRNLVRRLRSLGIKDIGIDPGFGFGKTVTQNYDLLRRLSSLRWIDCPILVGLSRKSMIYKALSTTAEQALNGTTALHMTALLHGAHILRVHDVQPAKETIQLYNMMYPQNV